MHGPIGRSALAVHRSIGHEPCIDRSIGRWHGSCIDRSVDRSSRMSRASIGRWTWIVHQSAVGMRRASIGQFASIGRSAIGHESCTDRPIRIDRASIGRLA